MYVNWFICVLLLTTYFEFIKGDLLNEGIKHYVENHENLRLLPKLCGISDSKYQGTSGRDAHISEFPWMALVYHRTGKSPEFLCSGVIINSRYVLTSAQCVLNNNVTGVRLGDHNVQTLLDTEIIGNDEILEFRIQILEGKQAEGFPDVKKFTPPETLKDWSIEEVQVHTNFSTSPNVKNDIALIRLSSSAYLTVDNARAVCFPSARRILADTYESGAHGFITSWELARPNVETSILHKAYVPIINSNTCKELYPTSSNVYEYEKDRNITKKQHKHNFTKEEIGKENAKLINLKDMHQIISEVQKSIINSFTNEKFTSTDVNKHKEEYTTNVSPYEEFTTKESPDEKGYINSNKRDVLIEKLDLMMDEFCAGGDNLDYYVDAGSPFTVPEGSGRRKRHVLYGIFSQGDSGHPGKFMDVSKYLPWILNTIRP